MDWKIIKSEAQYQKAIKRTMTIFHAEEGTPEADELALLLVLIKDFKDKHIQFSELEPVKVIIRR